MLTRDKTDDPRFTTPQRPTQRASDYIALPRPRVELSGPGVRRFRSKMQIFPTRVFSAQLKDPLEFCIGGGG